MSARDVVIYPDARLKRRSDEIGAKLEGISELVRDMTDTMYADNGIGLAAVQIGVLRRVFIVEALIAGGAEDAPPLVFIDPEIVELSRETEVNDEGCLSLPGVYIPVKRSVRAKFRARDVHGISFEIEGEGLFARCMQHEFDHLNGVVIADYVGRLKQKSILKQIQRHLAERDNSDE